MTRDRWQWIEKIFFRVQAGGGPEDRRLLLDALCKDDPELRREVELLLRAEAESGSFLASRNLPVSRPDQGGTQAAAATAGRNIAHYTVLSALGAGAMGEVFLARDSRLDRNVALKILPARFASDRERVARFVREAKASSALNHPNIVTLHDLGEDQGFWYIITEFIDGVTLRQRLASGPMDVEVALDVANQCASALAAAHARGVSHRDIKPENIMIRPDGLAKIVDFGLAHVTNSMFSPAPAEPETGAITEAGAIMGTPRYMSPEQARGERADAASDIFSLGAVLYEMLAGAPAFPGGTTAEVLASLLTLEPKPLRRTGIPPKMNQVLARALARNRDARYQSMQEFASDLRDLQHSLEWNRRAGGKANSPLRRFRYVAAAALLAAAGWIVWTLAITGRHGQSAEPWESLPLTTFAGFKDYAALSPDGKQLAFSWNGGRGGIGGRQERDIYVKPVGAGDPVQLTHSDQDNLWPCWSPDGRSIAFGRHLGDSEITFYIVSAAGGPERKIAMGGPGIAWSPDGSTLAMPRSGSGSGGIFLVNVKTGAQRDLTIPKPAYDSLPAFSKDGRWIAFARGHSDRDRGLWVVPASGGEARIVAQGRQGFTGVTWTSDSRDLVFGAIGEGGTKALFRVPREGGTARRLDSLSPNASNPNISGNRLTYTLAFLDTNIYRSEGAGFLSASAPAKFGALEHFIVSSREDDSPRFSPDGSMLVFVSTRSGAPELWVARRDGTHVVQLTSLKRAALGSPRWSPDNRRVAFDCRDGRNSHVYSVNADGTGLHRLTTDPAGDYLPAFSADGRWIYFTSDRSGRAQLWRMPAEGGAAAQITEGGAREAWPSPDGKLIYFTRTRPEAGIWTVPAEGGAEQPVPELRAFHRVTRSWGVIPAGIYFISREDGPRQKVRFLSFATRQVTLLAALDKEPIWYLPAIALSPDGRELLTVNVDQQVIDLMMIDNYR